MKKDLKIYTATLTHHGRSSRIIGTLKALAEYVSYTLVCGNSWNRKIKTAYEIKTIKQLQKAYDMSIDETQGSCYEPDYGEFREASDDEALHYNNCRAEDEKSDEYSTYRLAYN